jgi:hypothetical protein
MKKELNRKITAGDTEVDLFRKMADVLSATYNVTFVEETHQQYVTYMSPRMLVPSTREISDLWIITYSPEKKRSRMTFLQAKYHRGIMGPTQPSFHAEYFQYELMSRRPKLTKSSSKRFAFPNNILSFSCLHSLGSYGVFYVDSSGDIDLSYCCAHYLSTSAPAPRKYSSYKITLDMPASSANRIGHCTHGSWDELICCFDIDKFTKSLLKLEIGAELVGTGITSFVEDVLRSKSGNPEVANYLQFLSNNRPPSLVTGYDASDDLPESIIGLLSDIPPLNPNEGQDLFDGLPSSLLLINVDRKGER